MNIPLFPLDVVLFPGTPLPLHIFEDRYKEMIAGCLCNKSVFGVMRAQQEGLAVIGCTAAIVRVLERYSDGRLDILCEGSTRFEIESLDNSRSFLRAEVDFFDDDGPPASRLRREQCVALHFEALALMGVEQRGTGLDLNQPISLVLASSTPSDLAFKQELLALRSDGERTEKMIAFYEAMVPKLRRGVGAAKVAGHNGHVM